MLETKLGGFGFLKAAREILDFFDNFSQKKYFEVLSFQMMFVKHKF